MKVNLRMDQALALSTWAMRRIFRDPAGCLELASQHEWQAFATELKQFSAGRGGPVELPQQVLGLVLSDNDVPGRLRFDVAHWLCDASREHQA
jgi:hypothetical protein